jgi:large subunit ribosomal protein L4
MIQLALRSALSDRAADGKIVVVGSWPWEIPSTKDAKDALTALGLDGKVLVVLSRQDEEAYKSFRNLPDVQLLLDGELNAYDILCNDWIVFTTETLPGTTEYALDETARAPSPADEAVEDAAGEVAADDEPGEADQPAEADESTEDGDE